VRNDGYTDTNGYTNANGYANANAYTIDEPDPPIVADSGDGDPA
jgi:hypothetical protein